MTLRNAKGSIFGVEDQLYATKGNKIWVTFKWPWMYLQAGEVPSELDAGSQ